METVAAKPTFNVIEPFDGITIVQMNCAMRDLLRSFIFDFDQVEVEIYALAEGLTDPRKWHRKTTGAGFAVEAWAGVVSVQLNTEMLTMLKSFIDEADGHVEIELRALSKALGDPEGCYRLKKQRQQERRDEREGARREYEPAGRR